MIKKTPAEFEAIFGIKVLDPDGWDRTTNDYEKEITVYEFLNKPGPSTVSYSREFLNLFIK